MLNKKWYPVILLLLVLEITSCNGISEQVQSGDLIISLETGSEWLHDFSTLKKNPPQFVLWMEDEEGHYISTIFATRKVATEGWVFNRGNRRLECLPYWMHKRNKQDGQGTLLPSKDNPLTDSISGATPKSDVEILFRPKSSLKEFSLFLELNHSTDFNSSWPKKAKKGDPDWSGGEWGSGQPAVIYSVSVDLTQDDSRVFTLKGHSSADGSDGVLYGDTSSLTTALNILGSASVSLIP